jgi:hypothetical protein
MKIPLKKKKNPTIAIKFTFPSEDVGRARIMEKATGYDLQDLHRHILQAILEEFEETGELTTPLAVTSRKKLENIGLRKKIKYEIEHDNYGESGSTIQDKKRS